MCDFIHSLCLESHLNGRIVICCLGNPHGTASIPFYMAGYNSVHFCVAVQVCVPVSGCPFCLYVYVSNCMCFCVFIYVNAQSQFCAWGFGCMHWSECTVHFICVYASVLVYKHVCVCFFLWEFSIAHHRLLLCETNTGSLKVHVTLIVIS